MSIQKTYRCQYCDRGFSRKSWYDKHECENRKKFDQKHEITLISAHKLFNEWCLRNRFTKMGKDKTIEQFKKSPFFGTFVNLAEFIDRFGVTAPYQYVHWLSDNQYKEVTWTNKDMLAKFQDYLREQENPEAQAKTSLLTIRKWSSKSKVEPKNFFKMVSPGDIVVMVKTSQISPWVLFGYERSLVDLVDRLDQEYLYQINEYINTTHWMNTIRGNPDQVDLVRSIMDEGLDAV